MIGTGKGLTRTAGRTGGGVLAVAFLAASASMAGEGANYARVRHAEDVLTVERPARAESFEAGLNRPIAPGDRLHSPAGRGTIELADSSLVWTDRGSVLEFRTLADYGNRQERTNLLVLQRGRMRVDTRDPQESDAVFQIDTEAGSVYLLSAGSFRIQAEGGVTTLASFGGVAEFSGDGGSILVRSGQSSSVPIGGAPTAPRRFNTARGDSFDRYHDEWLAASVPLGGGSAVDGGMVAGLPEEIAPYASELSLHGAWHTLPTFGPVWRPHYAGAWSPFFHGSWAWYPAGWVWVSLEPWGWAPYHFGRWEHTPALGWFWIPGTAWSGAWVVFVIGPTHVGWCPLNYWNRPVFHDSWVTAPASVDPRRLDARGWAFTPIEQFGGPGPAPAVVRGDRVPRERSLVVSRALPRFDPAAARRRDGAATLVEEARRARVPLPAPRADGQPVSFRVEEKRARDAGTTTATAPRGGRPRNERPAVPSRPPRETGAPVVATPAPAPSATSPRGTAKDTNQSSGHAVGRLVNGARPASPGRPPGASGGGSTGEGTRSTGRKPSARPPVPRPAEPPKDDPTKPDSGGGSER